MLKQVQHDMSVYCHPEFISGSTCNPDLREMLKQVRDDIQGGVRDDIFIIYLQEKKTDHSDGSVLKTTDRKAQIIRSGFKIFLRAYVQGLITKEEFIKSMKRLKGEV